jgi:hypothetical protein
MEAIPIEETKIASEELVQEGKSSMIFNCL